MPSTMPDGAEKGTEAVSVSIFVGNLPWSYTDVELADLFTEYGDVLEATVVCDRETGRSRGFGFVEMASGDARLAIRAVDGSEASGRPLTVNRARARLTVS